MLQQSSSRPNHAASTKQIKKHFLLKQFKECTQCIYRQYGSMDSIVETNNDSLLSILVQCYYEMKDYQTIHQLFEMNKKPSGQFISVYIQLCIKLHLFDKVTSLLNDHKNTLSESERKTLSEYNEKELKSHEETTSSSSSNNKDFPDYRPNSGYAEVQRQFQHMLTSMKHVQDDETEMSQQQQHDHRQRQTPLTSPKQSSQTTNNTAFSLLTLPKYIFNFIKNHKVEIIFQVVSFIILYTILK